MQRRSNPIRRWLAGTAWAAAVSGAVVCGTWLAFPWLAARLAPVLASAAGFELLELEVGRPGLTGLAIKRVRATGGRIALDVREALIRYRAAALLQGRVEAVDAEQATVTVAQAEVGASAWDPSAVALPPLPLDGFAARLPVGRASIRLLRIAVPALDFAGSGHLTLEDSSFELRLEGHAPAAAAGLTTVVEGDLEDLLRVVVSERTHSFEGLEVAGASSLRLSAQRQPDALRIEAEADLAGFVFELAAALAGLPAGAGELALTAAASLPWPLPAAVDWQDLDLAGDLAARWPPAAGGMVLGPLEGRWRLQQGELSASFTGVFSERGRTLPFSAETAGLSLDPDGVPQGSLVARIGTPARPTLDLEASVRDARVDTRARIAIDASDWTWLAERFDLAPLRGSGRAVLVAGWPWSGSTLPDLQRLDAELEVQAARLSGVAGFDLIEVEATRFRLHGAALTGSYRGFVTLDAERLALSGDLALAVVDARPVRIEGTLTGGPFQAVRWRLVQDLAGGSGSLTFDGSEVVERPLLATLLPGHAAPWDLDGGRLDFAGAFRWSGAPGLPGSLRVNLADGSARYGTFRLAGIETGLTVEFDHEGWHVPMTAVRAAALDVGVALSDVQVRAALDPVALRIESLEARILGGTVNVGSFDYDIATGSARLAVVLTGLELERVLALYGAQVAGTGILDAALPVVVDNGAIRVVGGTVTARPDGGVIRLSPELAQGAGQPGLDFALRALADFTYTSLSAGVDYAPDGDLTLAVALRGRNPAIERGRPIHYNLTVSENVLQLIESLSVQDRLVERLERGFAD